MLGEFCVLLVVLFFIMKVVFVKYVFIMMGVYFVAIGLGNKVVGVIGEFF